MYLPDGVTQITWITKADAGSIVVMTDDEDLMRRVAEVIDSLDLYTYDYGYGGDLVKYIVSGYVLAPELMAALENVGLKIVEKENSE